mgnify:CR=1 FL=1
MKKGGFGKNKPVLITIVALVVLAAMILASAGRGTANWFENAVGAVLTPVQGFAARASNSIADFFRGVFNTTDADKENAKLKSELALYNKMQLELEELKKENERLRGLLDLKGTYDLDGVAARVSVRVLRHPSRGGQRIFIFGFSPLMPGGIRALMLTCP